jgi:hypothetical protein
MIYFPFELVKKYEHERIKEAEHYWQLKQIRAGEPSPPAHLFAKISKFSVCLGRKLKKQYQLRVLNLPR